MVASFGLDRRGALVLEDDFAFVGFTADGSFAGGASRAGWSTRDAGAGAGSGAGGGSGGVSEAERVGRNASGSRYPLGSAVRLIPRCTWGSTISASLLGPTVPMGPPSETLAPFETSIAPSWTSVTDSPSGVWIVTVRPFVATEPAKLTLPAAGASTVVPTGAPTSIPRCCPPA
jgi:hypothetical protein